MKLASEVRFFKLASARSENDRTAKLCYAISLTPPIECE